MEVDHDPNAAVDAPNTNAQHQSNKASKSKKSKPRRPATQTTHTLRSLPWTYVHLTLAGANPTAAGVARMPATDEITARAQLTAALTQFLGLHGSAVVVDILKVAGRDAWVRVAREDADVLVEAAAGWAPAGDAGAWLVRGRSEFLGCLVAGDGNDLFRTRA